jgi:hypothetical protein
LAPFVEPEKLKTIVPLRVRPSRQVPPLKVTVIVLATVSLTTLAHEDNTPSSLPVLYELSELPVLSECYKNEILFKAITLR